MNHEIHNFNLALHSFKLKSDQLIQYFIRHNLIDDQLVNMNKLCSYQISIPYILSQRAFYFFTEAYARYYANYNEVEVMISQSSS